MIPLIDTVPSRSFPIVNWLLIGINVLAFLLLASLGLQAERVVAVLGVVPVRLLAAPASQAITLLTSMFLHGGWLHLFSNMLALYIFGDNVEAMNTSFASKAKPPWSMAVGGRAV